MPNRRQQYLRYAASAIANMTTIPYEKNFRPLLDGTARPFAN